MWDLDILALFSYLKIYIEKKKPCFYFTFFLCLEDNIVFKKFFS